MRRDSIPAVLYALALAAGLGIVLFAGKPYLAQVVVWIALNVALAASLRFMLLVGEVNLGIGAFFGIGAYGAAVLCVKLGFSAPVAILCGGLLAALASIPFGYLTLRLTGHYFMLVSFALTEILRLIYTQSPTLGGNGGMVGIVPGIPGFGALAILISAAIFGMLLLLERSHLGRIFAAVSQNHAQVSAVGISVPNVKLLCLVASSFTAGLAGSTFAYSNTVIAPGDFGFLLSVFALAYVKIGGQSHPLGVLIGTVLLSVIAQYMMAFGAQDTLLYGTAIVATMLFIPDGIVGLFRQTGRDRAATRPAAARSQS